MKLYSIPIHLIRQYLFCPRIVYFLEILQIPKQSPIWVQEGSKYHIKQNKLMNRRTLKRFHLENATFYSNISLFDDTLGIHGVCDGLLETKTNIYPIEFKLHGKKPMKSQIFQLCAYGILASKKYNKSFNKGFILFEDKGKTFPINYNGIIKYELNKILQKIRELINKQMLPHSSATEAQCSQCEFLNYCNDRF